MRRLPASLFGDFVSLPAAALSLHIWVKSDSTVCGTPGTSPRIKVTTPIIDNHRIALLGGGKYRLYIESPHDYDNVYISYYAGREDQGRDQLVIKNYKQEGVVLKEVGEKRMGPISIRQGSNLVFVEFDENEVMALIPEFSMEVRSE